MKIGAYEVVGEAGRGGMGTVLRATDAAGRVVAIKLLRHVSAQNVRRFDREARIMAELGESEGFVPVLDTGQTEQSPFVVMPFLPGGSLRDRLVRGQLEVEETLRIGRALARSLANAHARGIVHRDLKPENVLFDEGDRPLIADLGLAKHEDPRESIGAHLSSTGEMRGTPGYMPLEQIRDAKRVAPTADVFALGAMLFECLTGRAAFAGMTILEVIDSLGRPPMPIRASRPETPAWLAAAIERAMEREPGGRFADGGAFLRALEPPARRGFLALALATTVAVAAIVVAATRREKSTEPVAPRTSSSVSSPVDVPATIGARPALPDDIARDARTPRTRIVSVLGSRAFKCESRPRAASFLGSDRVALLTETGFVHVFEASSGRETGFFPMRPKAGVSLATSMDPTTRVVTYISGHEDGVAVVTDGSPIEAPVRHELEDHEGAVVAVGVSPDARRAFTASEGGVLRAWDLATFTATTTIRAQPRRLRAAAFSTAGNLAATAADGEPVRIHELDSGRERLAIPIDASLGAVTAVGFADWPTRFLVGTERGFALELDETGREASRFPRRAAAIRSVTAELDGSTIVTTADDGTVAIGRGRAVPAHRLGMRGAWISLDGKRAVSVSAGDAVVESWDLSTGERVVPPHERGHGWAVRAAAAFPDGRRVATAGFDCVARIWDLTTGRTLRVLEEQDLVAGIACSPDGGRVVTGAWDKTLGVWDAGSGKRLATLTGHEDRVNGVDFIDDDHVASASFDGTVRIRDLRSSKCTGVLRGHAGHVYDVRALPDKAHVVSTGQDGTIRIFRLEDGTETRRVGMNSGSCAAVTPSRDGRRALVACGNVARLVDLQRGETLATYSGATGPIMRAIFSPDERFAIVASVDDRIRIHDLATGAQVDFVALLRWGDLAEYVELVPGTRSFLACTQRGRVFEIELDPPR